MYHKSQEATIIYISMLTIMCTYIRMCYDYEKGSHKPSIKNRKEDPSKSRNERTQKRSLHLQHRQKH